VKVYAYGEPAKEMARLREICAQNNWIFKQLTGMGRPRGDYPIQKVLDAYRSSGGNVRAAAKALKLAPTTVLRIVRREAAQKGDGASGVKSLIKRGRLRGVRAGVSGTLTVPAIGNAIANTPEPISQFFCLG